MKLDTLVTLAESEDIPRSEHWYTGLAWIMMECGKVDVAIEHFQKALEISSPGWVAMEGLARCYGNLGEYRKAIDWMEQGIKDVQKREGLTHIYFYMRSSISTWHPALGDADQAAENAEVAYSSSKQFLFGTGTTLDDIILHTIAQCVTALFDINRYDKIVDILYELNDIDTHCDVSLLVMFLQEQSWLSCDVNIYDKIGTILRDRNDETFEMRMTAAIDRSATLSNAEEASIGLLERNSEQINWSIFQAAQWKYRWSKKPEDSITLLEKLMVRIDESNETIQPAQHWIRTKAAGLLSKMYFQAALAYTVSPSDITAKLNPISLPTIMKLNTLAKHKRGGAQYYRASYPAMLYGVWLRDHGNASEEEWRACFRPTIKRAIYLLSDEDPWNDQYAYGQLGIALMRGGDTVNASIAMGIMLKPLADLRSRASASNNEKTVGNESVSGSIKDEGEAKTESMATDSTRTLTEATKGVSDNSASSKAEINPKRKTPKCKEKETENGEAGEAQEEQKDTKEEGKDNEAKEKEKQEEKEIEDEEDGETNAKLTGFRLRFSCDGPCNRSIGTYKELHFCQICFDICFCESCVHLLKRKEIPFRICSPDHQLLRVFPLTSEAKDMVDSLVARDFGPQANWLEEMSKF